MENVVLLENWSMVSGRYEAPELGFSFHGNVYGHPIFNDGDGVTTTKIIDMKDNVFYTRSGTKYKLGKTDPEYEKLFPNALERMLKQAEKVFK